MKMELLRVLDKGRREYTMWSSCIKKQLTCTFSNCSLIDSPFIAIKEIVRTA